MRVRILLASAVAIVMLSLPALAAAHKGSANYRSTVRSLAPSVPGVDVQVINYDDRLLLVNKTGREVEVRGYEGEPYFRVLGNGTVQVNKRSESYYLNLDRFGDIELPPEARNNAPPRWDTIDRTGRFEWHDHRIHYMSKSLPNQVTDKDERTKIFDWKVPLDVDGRRVLVKGDLFWVPSSGGGLPRGALIALGTVVIAAVFFVEVVRRRRRRRAGHRADASQAWG
jgi:hypothetical protein